MKTPLTYNSTEDMQDEDVPEEMRALARASLGVRPSEDMLRATLAKIPAESPRTFRPILSPFSGSAFSYLKIGVPVVALVLIVAGSTTFATHTFAPSTAGVTTTPAAQSAPLQMSNPNDTSDAAISQDSSVIDSQLNALDSDISATDQALK